MAKPRKTRQTRAAVSQATTVPRSTHPPQRLPSKGAEPATPRAAVSGAIITRRAADRLRAGHLWVYASDVESIVPPGEEELIAVADQRGLFLGMALYSPSSQIVLRLVSRQALDHAAWLELIETRLRAAIKRRKPMLDAANDACRLCFSEADELPGIIADKYGDIIVLQLLTKGLLAAGVKDTCVRVLCKELKPAAILERPDPRIRELESLPAPEPAPLWVASKKRAASATQFHLNGLTFHYDANAGQKTGAFLDQRTNYEAAREWVRRLAATNSGFKGPRTRCLLLPGRLRASPCRSLQQSYRCGCVTRLARSG